MKCPVLTSTSERLTGMTEYPPLDCLQAECAWYDVVMKECCILIIGRNMVGIGINIHNIAEDMPFKREI